MREHSIQLDGAAVARKGEGREAWKKKRKRKKQKGETRSPAKGEKGTRIE